MAQELSEKALGLSVGTISAVCMLLIGILGNLGVYMVAVEMMQQWHLFFDLSFVGIIAGIVEASIIGFAGGWLVAWVYNKFA
jgi:hypothetical protein